MDRFFVKYDFFNSTAIKQFWQKKAGGINITLNVSANGKKYQVFTPELFALLTTKEIPSEHDGNFLDGFTFITDYAKGFENGTAYFDEEFVVKADTLYSNPETYINNLHLNYYHKCPAEKKGWVEWIESYPLIVNCKTIEEYGYYAGVKFALDQLIAKHPVLFKNFNICPEVENTEHLTLQSIFNDKNNAFEILKGLLVDLEITINGKPFTKKGRVGKLTGLITAIKQTPGMLKLDNPTDDQLLKYFNEYLGTDYTTFSKRNEAYQQSIDDAKRFINHNFKK